MSGVPEFSSGSGTPFGQGIKAGALAVSWRPRSRAVFAGPCRGAPSPYTRGAGQGVGLAEPPGDAHGGGWVAGKARAVPAVWIRRVLPRGITRLGQPPPAAAVLALVSPKSPQPPPQVRAEPSHRQPGHRCRGAGSAPPGYTYRAGEAGGRARCSASPHPGTTPPDVHPQLWPQPGDHPKPQAPRACCSLPALLGRQLRVGRGRALPVLLCRGLPGPADLRRGFLCCPKFGDCSELGVWPFLDRVLHRERQSPSVRLVGGSDPGLPLGPSPAVASPPFPAPVTSDFLCQAPELTALC